LSTYVRRENGTTAADIGCHDDLVMSLAIGLYVLIEEVTPVGSGQISETAIDGANRIDFNILYGEVEEMRRLEERTNRRIWSQYRRATRRTRRSRG
jgi:hypothetical protein